MLYHDAFVREFEELPAAVQDALLAMASLLVTYGPHLGRPHADTLAGSRHANMKELRFKAANGVWRVAFAVDPDRQAVLLIAGDKTGVAQPLFYKRVIAKADKHFAEYLKSLEDE